MFLKSLVLALLVATNDAFQVGTGRNLHATTTALSSSRLKVHVDNGQQLYNNHDGRRSFLVAGAACAASLLLQPIIPVHADGGVDYKAVAKDVMALVNENPDWGPSESCVQRSILVLLLNEI